MKIALIVAMVLCLFSSVARAQDPHHPSSPDCSSQLNAGTLFPTMAVQATSTASTTTIPKSSEPSNAEPSCTDYAYVQVSGTYSSMSVTPAFGGPNISSSDWDCNHSVVNYTVYNADANGVYSKVGFGLLFGRLVNGVCIHDKNAFASAGTNSVSIATTARNPIVALRSWNHNDVDFSHPGSLCSADNCYWPSQLTVSGPPSATAYYNPWVLVPDGTPFQPIDQYGPSFISKKSFRIWAFAVPYDNTLWRRTWSGTTPTSWTNWASLGQTNVSAVASGCNWLASGGVDGDRNVVAAYVGWDGRVRVGVAMGSAVDFTWNVMTDTTDNAAQPLAVACGDGVLTLVVKKNNGTVAFKRNIVTASTYNFATWSPIWTTIPMPTSGPLAGHQIAGGVAAAKTAPNTVTVASSEMDANFNASNSCVMANIVNGVASPWSIITSGGCRQTKFSTPAMTGRDGGGARIVVFDQSVEWDPTTTVLRTATSSNGTTWTSFKFGKGIVPASFNCKHPHTRPAITQSKSSGEITIGAACDGQAHLRTVVIPTP